MLLLFFFNVPATTEISTLSLHDALPIWPDADDPAPAGHDPDEPDRDDKREDRQLPAGHGAELQHIEAGDVGQREEDRKSTRLNSSHSQISYAVFCLKNKNEETEKSVLST